MGLGQIGKLVIYFCCAALGACLSQYDPSIGLLENLGLNGKLTDCEG